MSSSAQAIARGRGRTRRVLGVLGDHFTSPVFTAALELWVAARTDPQLLAELAVEAEQAGWDGFWVWDHVQWSGEDDGQPARRASTRSPSSAVSWLSGH